MGSCASTDCKVCYDSFSCNKRPKVLPCGHTICEKCIETLLANDNHLQCPFCQRHAPRPSEELPTNFSLLNLGPTQPTSMDAELREQFEAGVAMTIFVKTISDRTMSLTAKRSDSIYTLKTKIEAKEGMPPATQRLIYGGKQLEDHKTLEDYNIQKDSTINLVIRCTGGWKMGQDEFWSTPKNKLSKMRNDQI